MDNLNLIVQGVICFIATFVVSIGGAAAGRPSRVITQKVNEVFTPLWLLAIISAVATVLLFVSPYIATINDASGPIIIPICCGWFIVIILVAFVVERIMWAAFPRAAETWLEKAIERKRQQDLEADRQKQERLAKTGQGIFTVALNGANIELGGAFCYLYVPGLGMQAAPNPSKQITLDEQGIHPGKDMYYKGRLASALDVGAITPVGFISGALATEEYNLSIPWADVVKCIVNVVTVKYFFLFYTNKDKGRPEWIAINLASPEEMQVFQDTLKRYGVAIEEAVEPLVTFK